jgi:hypothetical protein
MVGTTLCGGCLSSRTHPAKAVKSARIVQICGFGFGCCWQLPNGRVRQQIIRALGRKDMLLANGELDRLAASLVRHCDRAVMLSDMEAGRIACTRIGGPLLFGRLWERLGIAEVLGELLQDRGFEFAVERAVFASVLHRFGL